MADLFDIELHEDDNNKVKVDSDDEDDDIECDVSIFHLFNILLL